MGNGSRFSQRQSHLPMQTPKRPHQPNRIGRISTMLCLSSPHPFQTFGCSRPCALATVQPTAAVGHCWRPARLPGSGPCSAAWARLRQRQSCAPVRQPMYGVVPSFLCHAPPHLAHATPHRQWPSRLRSPSRAAPLPAVLHPSGTVSAPPSASRRSARAC